MYELLILDSCFKPSLSLYLTKRKNTLHLSLKWNLSGFVEIKISDLSDTLVTYWKSQISVENEKYRDFD